MNTVGGILIAENVKLLKFDAYMQFLCKKVRWIIFNILSLSLKKWKFA